MKIKYIFLIVLAVAIGSGLYFFKDEIFEPGEITSWNFVPANAVSVWESNRSIEIWNRFVSTDHWSNLSAIPAFNKINTDLVYLDSLTGSNGNLDRILQTSQFLISLHTISRNQFDYIFYLELTSEEFRNLILELTESFSKGGRFSYSERTYHDQLIIEINDESAKKTFSYFVHDNHFVASFTPFLIEDAIRTYRNENENFEERNEEAFNLASLEFDAGNLYLNLKNLQSFAELFFKDRNEKFLQPFQNLKGSGFMDVDFDKNFIFANGFLVTENDSSYLEVFNNQQPVPTQFSNFIPYNASKIFYQCFDNIKDWHQRTIQYWSERDPGFSTRYDSLVNGLNFDIERLHSWMGSQLVLVDLESVDQVPGKLVLVESKDVYEALNQLNRITEEINEISGDTLYSENYGELTIQLLNLKEFPSKLFGDWYEGFPVTYYTMVEPFVILSNDIEPIKGLINDREEENTWGQSLSKDEFIRNTLDNSNLGILINTSKAWNQIQPRLAQYWQKGWTNYARTVKQLELASLQISRSSDKYYGSLVLKNRSFVTRDISRSGAEKVMSVGMGNPIIMKPKVTRNHRDGSWEVMVLDSTDRISLIDRSGQVLWQQFLDSPIKGDIFQIDFFKNRKLQYLFATDSLLQLIDRNGETVDDYPKSIADIKTISLSVIDYDNTKNYRFMLTQDNGDIYLLDKEGNRLEGWSPKSFIGRFVINPFHLRVRSRDVFVGIKENGEVVATNRRGEAIQGFPIDLDAQISGDIFYQIRSDFARTIFTVVSEEGEVIKFNLQGKVTDRTQLYRPATDTRFWLVNESLGKTYLIARQDLNRLAVIDRNGELLFEKDYFSYEPFEIQYYNFGAGQDMLIVGNAEPGKVLVYDINGNLIVPQLDSDFPVSIIHYESRSLYHLYTAASDSLFVYSIPE